MNGLIFVSYATIDHAQGSRLVAFLRAALGAGRVAARSGVGRSSEHSLSPAQSGRSQAQQLTGSDLVVALLTPLALASGEVPFELGAAWALRKRCVLLRTSMLGPHDVSPWLVGPVESIALTPAALVELARSLAIEGTLEGGPGWQLNAAARSALHALFPDWQPGAQGESALGASRSSSPSSAPPSRRAASQPPPSLVPAPPHSCKNSLLAGRAIADCLFAKREGEALVQSPALDLTFGPFIAALGENWETLRQRNDPEHWHTVAQQALGQLGPDRRAPLHWYRMGVELGTLINLAGGELRAGVASDPAFDARWQTALDALCEAGLRERVNAAALAEVARLLDSLRVAPDLRDYANLSRAQNRLRRLATERDQEPAV